MDLRSRITLPAEFVDMSWGWARRLVEDYAAGRNANSRAVTCFDAHSNTELQARAKMSECAFALFAGADPKYAIHWGRESDGGNDLNWRGKLWDVKATSMRGRFLIWPIAKNHIFESKRFDCLVLVKNEPPLFVVAGWIPKKEFAERKRVATENHKLFPGTWHLDETELWGVDLLLELAA